MMGYRTKDYMEERYSYEINFIVLKPYRLSVVSIVILTFLSSMLQLYLPTLTADIVDVGIVQEILLTYGRLAAGWWLVLYSPFCSPFGSLTCHQRQHLASAVI